MKKTIVENYIVTVPQMLKLFYFMNGVINNNAYD